MREEMTKPEKISAEDHVSRSISAARSWRQSQPDRKATINDIAKIAGVSKKTISRIINNSPYVKNETRESIKAIMTELGYAPNPQARGLNFTHSFLIGLIYDNPNPQYVVTSQEGVLDVLKSTEYELLVHPCDRSDPSFIEEVRNFIQRQRLFGVVLTPSVSEDERLAEMLRSIGCRHIRIASVELGAPEHMLVTHDAVGAEKAAQHLIELGHEKIGYLSGRLGFRSSEERQRGLERGLESAGLKLPADYIIEGDYKFESGLASVDKFFALANPPTAVFCANDQMAAGFLQGLRLSGRRAPCDMSVVGFDDFRVAQNVWPRLTTIHMPTSEFARIAAYRVLDTPIPEKLTDVKAPWLIVRDSTDKPRKT
jgi:LacI family transcriptional regulator